MVRSSIALNPHQVTAWLPRITDGQIDEETSHADLGLALITMARQHLNDCHLEVTVRGSIIFFDVRHPTRLSEVQKVTQCLHASAGGSGYQDIGRTK
ncbi:hypothetical protein D3C81_1947700 [compost metagenome]